MKLPAIFRPATPRGRVILLILPLLTGVVAGTTLWRRAIHDNSLTATVQRGSLTAYLTTSGTLRPVASLTYRSPMSGREVEITALVPEGTRVGEGDLLVRLDTSELQLDMERVRQELRQSQLDLQVADIEQSEAEAAVQGVAEGEGALAVEEARTRLQLAEKKVARLREEHAQLAPLMQRGVITREELKKTADALEQSEEELALARKRTTVAVQVTHPRDTQRAALQLAQRNARLETARTRVKEAEARLAALVRLIDECSLHARRPGLVVYEEFLGANPRRKIRVGDRVTGSQGLVTIPEVDRMLLEASVGEGEVHRVRPGQTAKVRVEAFPNLRLDGRVVRVGTLARSSIDRPFDDKRFDLIIELDTTAGDLRPEMTASADVAVGAREGVLVVPVNAVFERQGSFVAHIVNASGVDTRRIEIGASNDRLVEVTTGLREGDRVMLTEPEQPEALQPSDPDATGNALNPR
jgi:multidrug resistance efflux pump